MFGLFKRSRRRRLRQRPFPADWSAILARRVPGWSGLSPAERRQIQADTLILLAEKLWEGCGGLVLSDEIRVTIAGQAALLLLNRETDYFSKLTTILVYPALFVADAARRLPDGTVIEGPEVRAGEAWSQGAVVLSWDDSLKGTIHPHDGYNVVLHEFAHQLDAETGAFNGAPRLPRRSMYERWARILGREFAQLQADVAHGRPTVLRPYGASNPAEFFAVATETFFERSTELRRRHPELYEQLSLFYQQDPAAR